MQKLVDCIYYGISYTPIIKNIYWLIDCFIRRLKSYKRIIALENSQNYKLIMQFLNTYTTHEKDT